MTTTGQPVLFTDLDGTLLDHKTYSFQKAQEALHLLADRQIPVVLCSSKTRAEIEVLRERLGLAHPFISENGGAIFIPGNYFPFALPNARWMSGYDIVEFGAPYHLVVNKLHSVANEAGVRVLGFSDMSVEEVAARCELPVADANLAKLRDYDEAFLILDDWPAARSRLFDALHRAGLRCTSGGRFHHLAGVTDKGLAVRSLCALFRQTGRKIWTIGLGDSLNDLPLLRETDTPVVVRGVDPEATARLLQKIPSATVTAGRGPRGWNDAVLRLLDAHSAAQATPSPASESLWQRGIRNLSSPLHRWRA